MTPHKIRTDDGVVIAETPCITTAYRCYVNASRRLALKTITVEYARAFR